MNKEQALAMLKFIADLYQIIQAPDPEPAAEPVQNGRDPVPTEHMTVPHSPPGSSPMRSVL